MTEPTLVHFECDECDEPLVGVDDSIGRCPHCHTWADVPECTPTSSAHTVEAWRLCSYCQAIS